MIPYRNMPIVADSGSVHSALPKLLDLTGSLVHLGFDRTETPSRDLVDRRRLLAVIVENAGNRDPE
jgi:hypothetical protein